MLIAESELNRTQLVGDLAALMTDVRSVGDRARSFGSIASSAAVLVTGLAAFRQTSSVFVNGKRSWQRTLLKGAGLLSTFWLAFRAKGRDQANQ